MPKKKRVPPGGTKFKVDEKVRVKHGIRDADYPDIPLGGWAGTVIEVDEYGMHTIQWSEETLGNIHPIVKRRSARDGTVLEEYWLNEDDLELDNGVPLSMEQPTEIATKPLSPKNQSDRVRMIFGLTSNDPLPAVGDETLSTYHAYLAKHLAFPFQANYGAEYGPPERVKVIGLGDPDKEPMIDDEYGLLCESRAEGSLATLPLCELGDASPNRQLIDDYCYWFHNW